MNEDIDKLRALLDECSTLIAELERVLDESMSRTEKAKYKRIIETLRRDNERLYRDNIMMKSALIEGK